jgi:hypothetical protein
MTTDHEPNVGGASIEADPAATRRSVLIAALGTLDKGPEERFERITRIARETFGVRGSFLNLVGDRALTIKSQQYDHHLQAEWELDDTFCGRSVGEDGTVVIPDARADARYADVGFVTGEDQIRFYAGAPLTVGDDHTKIGTLCLIDPAPRTLDEQDLTLLQDLAHWAERELAAGIDEDRLRSVLEGMAPSPPELVGYRVAGLSIPNALVSGDYHNWQATEDGLHLTVADVMGKGMAAGLLASGMRAALIARSDLGPDQAVAELEMQIGSELSRADAFATLFHGRLHADTGRLDFVDAGHGLVLHVRSDGTDDVVRSLDLPIGLQPAIIPRASGSIVIEPGDALLVVTDGVLEIWDSTLSALSELGAVYRKSADLDDFFSRVRTLVQEHDPGDDLTILAVARDH